MKIRDKGNNAPQPVPVPLAPTPQAVNPTQRNVNTGFSAKFEQTTAQVRSHTGPLPDPSILAEYNAVLPGLAERIVSITEQQFEHRRARERDELNADIEIAKRTSNQVLMGQVFSLIVSLTAILAGTYIAVNGQPWVAGAFGTAGIAGIVNGIIQRRNPPQLQGVAESTPLQK